MEKTTRSEPTPEEIKRGYEVGDVSLRGAVWATGAFIAFGIVTHVFLTIVWKVSYQQAEQVDQPLSVISDDRPPAFAPPLQPSIYHDTQPKEDNASMMASENKVFESMGWKLQDDKKTAQVPDSILAKVQARQSGTTRPAGGNR